MADISSTVSKLRDDLKASESKFNVESYLTSSEASKYLSELPGLEDIISSIKGFIDSIKDFANMVLGFINKILSFLNLNNILDALGLKSLLDFISNIIYTGLGIIGLSLGDRARLSRLFNSICMPIGISAFTNGYDRNLLERFALMALILGLTCSMPGQGFTNMYNVMRNTPKLVNLRDEVDELDFDLEIARNNPVFVYSSASDNYIVDQTATDDKILKTQSQIDALNREIDSIELQIDNLFANFVPIIFTNTYAMSGMSSTGIVSLTTEIATNNVAPIVSNNNMGLSSSIMNAIDSTILRNIDAGNKTLMVYINDTNGMSAVNEPLYGAMVNKHCPELNVANAYDVDDMTILGELPNDMTSFKLRDAMASLDSSVSVTSLNSSPVMRALARRDLEAELLSEAGVKIECPNDTITDTLRYIA